MAQARPAAVIGPIDTYKGTTAVTCTVVEVLPANPIGYTFGNPSYSPTDGKVTITKGRGADAALVTVTNTISKDQGYFKISKVFGSTAYTGDFTMNYVCTDTAATTGTVDLGAGETRAMSSVRLIPTKARLQLPAPSSRCCRPTRLATPSATHPYSPTDGKVTITKGRQPSAGNRHQHDQPRPGLLQDQQGLRQHSLHRRLHHELRLHRHCCYHGTVQPGAGKTSRCHRSD